MQRGRANSVLLTVYACALLLSAALLFNIQPMLGKLLLPRVGGAPQVWNVALAFFQLALLSGYLIAHLLSRLSVRVHGLIYLAILALAMLGLPIALPTHWELAVNGYVPLEVLHVLLITVALPFIALSLSAPTLQRLFSNTAHQQAADPYFLYVASNLGSFIGLLAYPLLLEPLWTLHEQSHLWQLAYMLLIGLAALCLLLQTSRPTANAAPVITTTAKSSWKQRAMWLLLALIPSSLTLGVTTYITTDLTAAPLLWVITLSLYLLSFVLAFAQRGEVLRQKCITTFPWLAGAAILGCLVHINSPWPMVILNLLAFFTTAVACHTYLARLRPPVANLTEFYLWLSIGGALGGSFNAFIAPVIFTRLLEYPLILMTALLLAQNPLLESPRSILRTAIALVVFGMLNMLMFYGQEFIPIDWRNMLLILFMATGLLLSRVKPVTLYAGSAVLLFAFIVSPYFNSQIYAGRDFFGVITVADRHDEVANADFRLLQHGTTTHGIQLTKPVLSHAPAGYYAPGSPLASIWAAKQPKSIAVIGLGTGALNCYAHPGQQVHFFEIDPLMIDVAYKYFTFLKDCPTPVITLGDGRLQLARDTGKYDMIVLDAFSSDSIPVHMLTREAISMYLTKLNPGGVIVAHISSRFFELEPVIAAIAQDLNLTAYTGQSLRTGVNNNMIYFPSEAVVLAPDASSLHALDVQYNTWRRSNFTPGVRAWTDEYSNIISALKLNSDMKPLHEAK